MITNRAISNDHYSGESSGKSPGYGVTLLAVTTEGFNYSAEMMRVEYQTAEELGTACSELLLEEIARGGCIDSIHQPLAILLLAFSQAAVSKIRTGPLTVTAVKVRLVMMSERYIFASSWLLILILILIPILIPIFPYFYNITISEERTLQYE